MLFTKTFRAMLIPILVIAVASTVSAAATTPKFGTRAFYAVDSRAREARSVDVNGDGKADLVVVNLQGAVTVYLGNGDGTFNLPVDYPAGGPNAQSLAVGDVNGDGKADLMVTNTCALATTCGNGDVAVLIGNGDGSFQPPVTYDTGGMTATRVIARDVDKDGKLDLLVVNSSSSSVGVLLGNGDGTFRAAVTYAAAGGTPQDLAVADMDKDGKLDLVVATSCDFLTLCGVDVLLGNGDGTFRAAVLRGAVSMGGVSLRVADFNGDKKPDVAMSTYDSTPVHSSIGVFLGNGDGTLRPVVQYSVGGLANQTIGYLAVGDVNGDGAIDMMVSTRCNPYLYGCIDDKIGLLLGNGDGTFQASLPFYTGRIGPAEVTLTDLNGDGKPDMVVPCSGNHNNPALSVRLNTTQATPQTALVSSQNPAPVNFTVTLTATVSGLYAGKTTGSVSFKQGPALLGTVPVVGGKAKLDHIFFKPGSFALTAVFLGDHNNLKSPSAVLTQVVMP